MSRRPRPSFYIDWQTGPAASIHLPVAAPKRVASDPQRRLDEAARVVGARRQRSTNFFEGPKEPMGVTIHYRGTIDDVSQVETMEDRFLNLVFSLGGRATIWRSFADDDSSRAVRGLIVNLEPGQETFSLLVSPEGHLTPLLQIKDAEKAAFDEPPYCFVKTQFGSLQGHVAIVHLLDALRQRFCSNLEVSDEGDYYQRRDLDQLARKWQFLRSANDSVAEGLREHGLSAEAAEDPGILAMRIERIVALVHQKIHTDRQWPSRGTEGEQGVNWSEPSLEKEAETMDRLRRQNELRSQRMIRRIAEATASGLSAEAAFELAIAEEGLPIPAREAEEPWDSAPSEPWIESLPSHPFDEADERSLRSDHPAVAEAQAFLMQVMDLGHGDANQSSFISMLTRASLDMVGGLAQATHDESGDNIQRALAITHLKRALSGHAYARGAIFGLRREKAITGDQSKRLHEQLQLLLATIHELSDSAWT
jgi:hypothetical protein